MKAWLSFTFFLTPHRLVPHALVLADYPPFYTTVPPLPTLLPLLRMPHLVHLINTRSPYKYQFKHCSLREESLFDLWQAHLISFLCPHRYLVHLYYNRIIYFHQTNSSSKTRKVTFIPMISPGFSILFDT